MKSEFDSLPHIQDVEPETVLAALDVVLSQASKVYLSPGEHIGVETKTGDLFKIRFNSDHTVHVYLHLELTLDEVERPKQVVPLPAMTFYTAQIMASRWVHKHGRIVRAHNPLAPSGPPLKIVDVYLHDWMAEAIDTKR